MSMKRCDKCDKYFPEYELDGPLGSGELQCIHCEEPHMEHPNAFPGIEGPLPPWLDLLSKTEVRGTRMEVVLPMLAKPDSSYVEAVVYEGPGRYWYIEGRPGKFKDSKAAIREVVQFADLKRHKALNDAFEKEFGNG